MDVEDLVALGRQVKGCPYFASRVMATMAELVFCPYNYILEPSIRKNLGIKLENCVIIFDEAHNIESIAADVASFECDLTILAAAVEELSHIVDSSDKAAHLLDSMKRLLQSIEAFAGLKVDDEVVWGGKEILALLDSSRITTETFKELFDTFSDLVSAAEEKNNADEGLVKDHRTADKVLTSVSETTLTNLFVTIQV
jgi:Fanconi anemia group J protein